MIEKRTTLAITTLNSPSESQGRRWTSVAGAWLGIGTSPGALLLGAGIATRHQGPVPFLSLVFGFGLMFTLIWFQGCLGLVPPWGDGGNLMEVTPRYFDFRMQKLVGAAIAGGMTGWFGFNVGLGAAALGSLVHVPQWTAVLVLGLPILVMSLRGIKGWNGLAALTTLSVLILIVLVVTLLGAHATPVTLSVDDPLNIFTDMAALVGFVSVFVVRAPDFTAGLTKRRDLGIVGLMLCVPLLITVLAGVDLQQGAGTDDLVGVLAQPNGLAIGNLLITLAVIAPTFTTLYSGVPALCAATRMSERIAVIIIATVGMVLAITRFDLWLLSWLGILAAILPPLLVPLAFESTARRSGRSARIVPMWVWLAGAVASLALTLVHHPLALLAGLFVSAGATMVWYLRYPGIQRIQR
jgi:cytosine permease